MGKHLNYSMGSVWLTDFFHISAPIMLVATLCGTHSPIPSLMMQSIWLTISMHFSIHTPSPAIHLFHMEHYWGQCRPPISWSIILPQVPPLLPLKQTTPQSLNCFPHQSPRPLELHRPIPPHQMKGDQEPRSSTVKEPFAVRLGGRGCEQHGDVDLDDVQGAVMLSLMRHRD